MSTQPNPNVSSLFELEYPQSVGVFDSYPEAQKAVDFLADHKFAVENLAIVGTDLKSVERVTGRKSWGTVLMAGVQSGLSTGLMVALLLWFVQPGSNPVALLPMALLIGITIGVVFAALGYAMQRGRRDFNSITQTVAAKYEVLCEHKVAAQARDLMRELPGARAAAFDPRYAPAPQQAYPAPQQSYPAPQQAYPAPQQAYPAPQQAYPDYSQGGHYPAQGSYPQGYDPGAGYARPDAPGPASPEGSDEVRDPRGGTGS